MDTDGKDVNGDSSVEAVVATTADVQEVEIIEENISANDVHSCKESVEILSVEVVQSAGDVHHDKDQIAVANVVNVEEQMETDLPAKDNEVSINEIDKNGVDSTNIMDKQGVFDTLPEINNSEAADSTACVVTYKDPLPTEGKDNNAEDLARECQVSLDIQKNTDTGIALSEEISENAMVQENITNSNDHQSSEEVSKSVHESNISDSPILNEEGDVLEISGIVLTPSDSLAHETGEELEISGIISTPTNGLVLDAVHDTSVVTTVTQDDTIEKHTSINSTTGLSLLAQYGSDNEANDSDNDSVIEVTTSNQDYRNRIVEIDSDTDSSSSGSDIEYLNKIRKTIEKRMEVDDDDEDEDEAENGNTQTGIRRKPKQKIKVRGEFDLDDLPPIEDLQITVAEDECIVLGKIHSIVDQLVLVSALPDSMLVDLESVLFLEKGKRVLGEVFDVLGQVADPLYCVRFNTNQQINEKNIQVNDVVYLAPKTQYTQYIILSSIMKQKGSDASWENDLEPPPRFLDYSDDEEQQLARRKMRNRDQPVEQEDPQKRQRRDSEEPQVSSYVRPYNTQTRPRYPPSSRGNGPPNRGSYGRPHQQYNPQFRNPHIPPNHNPSSWHSNYYPQAYAPMPPPNVAFAGGHPRMPAQAYPQVPVYPMGIPFPPPPPPQHGRPPNNQPAEHHHFMSNAFNMRPPTIPGHFDTSTLPPGSQ